jgi:hypothetical protein
LAFTSKAFSGRNLVRSKYEKEMMAILHAVHTWRPYLLGHVFYIKTNHHSLKYFLDRRLSSPEQNKWLTKMLGYDYEIIYKKGKDNVVVDALSRKHEEEDSLFDLSFLVLDWIEEVCQECLTHPTISGIIQRLQEDPNPPIGYTWQDNILIYKDRLVLSPSSALKPSLLNELHSSAITSHSAFQKTFARGRHYLFWEGMKKDILHFVTECELCQRNKGETINSPGALQPLPNPASMWTDISMDFRVGLPKVGNKSVIMVVVDRLSKYAHFCSLPHPFTSELVAQVFIDHIFKLHGIPTSIVSDCDPTFTNAFWQELFKL